MKKRGYPDCIALMTRASPSSYPTLSAHVGSETEIACSVKAGIGSPRVFSEEAIVSEEDRVRVTGVVYKKKLSTSHRTGPYFISRTTCTVQNEISTRQNRTSFISPTFVKSGRPGYSCAEDFPWKHCVHVLQTCWTRSPSGLSRDLR